MMKNKTGWVALIVLAIASLLMIFFVMPNINGDKGTVTAEKPAADQAKPAETAADAKGARPTAEDNAAQKVETPQATADAKPADAKPADAKPADAKPADGKPADPAAAWTVPGFDVLRVEPDGSTVIAGRAEPNTKLEIVNGETVVGTADVGSTGDFAAIFDKPLPAGDYQLTLRSVGENGATKSSDEVATVSIPKDKAGELLAMVSKPGEASRIITTPEGDKAAQPAAKPADAAAQTTTVANNAAEVKPVPDVAASGEAAKPAETATQTPATTEQPATAQTTAETPAAEKPATDTAAATPAVPATGGPSAVAVSAVEIEGRKIFVAGTAAPGALVRIYADDVLVGEMKADAQGRFVIDGTIDLSVGNHTIRADMMSADGSKVEMRAAVPFDRPAGDQVAAVAQPNAQGSVVPFDGGSFDGLRIEATQALGLLKGLFADGKVPSAEQLAAARSATEIALKSLADFKVADNLDAGVKEMVAKTAKAAADALAMLKALPNDAASISASLDKIEAAVGSALMPRTDGMGGNAVATQTPTPQPADNAATTTPTQNEIAQPAPSSETAQQPATGQATPSAESGAAVTTPESGAAATDSGAAAADSSAAATKPATVPATGQAASEPETVQQAPLTQTKTSVIIRRGDTLWQISRRVYGAGVRYTTIYLANEDQIADPNRILPGQIFGVPDKAMSEQDSEQEHRKLMK